MDPGKRVATMSGLCNQSRVNTYQPREDIEIRGLTLATGGVCTNHILEFAFATGKFAINVGRGHIVGASQKIDTTADIT